MLLRIIWYYIKGYKIFEILTLLSQRYGSIFRLRLFNKHIFVISGTTTIRKVLLDKRFSNRPYISLIHQTLQSKGIISSNVNKTFKQNKQFLQKQLTEFKLINFNKTDSINVNKTDSINYEKLYIDSFMRLLFGESILSKYSFKWMLDFISNQFKTNNLLSFIPSTKWFTIRYILRFQSKINIMIKNIISNKSLALKDSFIQNYIQLYPNIDQLEILLHDCIIAGIDNPINTLRWLLVYAALNPLIQKQMFEDYNQNKNSNKIDLFINEVMRLTCAGPILIPRETTEDIMLNNILIPKGAFIIINMWTCMRDKDYWDSPDEFLLDRQFSNNPAFIPFGLGYRRCPGSSMSKKLLKELFTKILIDYHITINKNRGYQSIFGIGIKPLSTFKLNPRLE